ncbi:hypothetical protein GN244_ATG10658 [Phytophthora infestans]|uniref:Uncharacterized protein n=1 Tax=Phytophthora infestans TaxID=4787 RepID=A0A833S8W2_PHYIN|nr:hypothetical protein GN244_ATG10658 [Phytophthora infestans]
MLDNRLRTRYNDAELVDATSKMIGKEVVLPKRKDVKEELARWRSEVTLRFPLYELDAIPYESERYDSQLGYVNPKYHRWYDTRRVMSFTAMALSLDMNLRDLFKVDELREEMEAPSLLWDRIVAYFTRGDGINPDYILRDLLNRELKPGETVDQYVTVSEELVRRYKQANGGMDEWEHASLLISSSQRDFRELAEQHTEWCSKNDRHTLTRADATRRLRQAEQARLQVASLQGSPET